MAQKGVFILVENKIPPTKMPERFVLDKSAILYILQSIRKHWDRDEMSTLQNSSYVSMMITMEALIKTPLVHIVTLKNVYFSVQEAARQLETLNQLKVSLMDAQEDYDNEVDPDGLRKKLARLRSFEALYDIQYEKVGSGKAFES